MTARTLTVRPRSDRDRGGAACGGGSSSLPGSQTQGDPHHRAARPAAERAGRRDAGLLEFMARLYDNGNIFLIEVCTTITLLI